MGTLRHHDVDAVRLAVGVLVHPVQHVLELVGVVEPHAAQHAEPAGRVTAAATFSDGVKTKIGYSMPKRSQSSVRISACTPACLAWTSSAGRSSVVSLAQR